MNDVGYVLLAGGEGRRMGGRNKLTVPYGNSTFGEIIKDEMKVTGRKCFLSVANYGCDSFDDFSVVNDSVRDDNGGYIGPLGGIYSTLTEASNMGLKGVCTVSCDMPFFNIKIFEALEKYSDNYDIITIRTKDGHVHYTCGYYSVSVIPVLVAMINDGNYRIRDAYAKCNTVILDSEKLNLKEEWFRNINSAEDYEKI